MWFLFIEILYEFPSVDFPCTGHLPSGASFDGLVKERKTPPFPWLRRRKSQNSDISSVNTVLSVCYISFCFFYLSEKKKKGQPSLIGGEGTIASQHTFHPAVAVEMFAYDN